MINENLLQTAIRIRQQYLKTSNNMGVYHKRAVEISEMLEESINDLDKLKEDIDKNRTQKDPSKSLENLMDIIKKVDDEGNRLTDLRKPMNEEIEKLQKEENELFRTIKEKHPNLSENEIIKEVAERLKKENL